jgi:hypothetical protein
MLQYSHRGPTPMMPWGGSPVAGQTSMWPPPPPLAGHLDQSSSTPPPHSGQGYWSPSWAPLAGGQASQWGMPLWTTSMPQRPSSSSPTVRHIRVFQLLHL